MVLAQSHAIRFNQPQVRGIAQFDDVVDFLGNRHPPFFQTVRTKWMPRFEPRPEPSPVGVVSAIRGVLTGLVLLPVDPGLMGRTQPDSPSYNFRAAGPVTEFGRHILQAGTLSNEEEGNCGVGWEVSYEYSFQSSLPPWRGCRLLDRRPVPVRRLGLHTAPVQQTAEGGTPAFKPRLGLATSTAEGAGHWVVLQAVVF